MLTGGYANRLLRVNLTDQTFQREELREDWVHDFVGARGLAARYLFQEVKPGTDPLGPDNKLIITIGPLSATGAQSYSRWMIITKSPLTDSYTRTVGGGFFGSEMRFAGYDMIIVEGKSEKPVYISITEDGVEFGDAEKLWGHTTELTHLLIKESLRDEKVRGIAIGPAGENLVRYAAVVADKIGTERGGVAGRGGAGAVMGAKNLKAIAIRGKGKVTIAHPERFKAAVKRQVEAYEASPMVPSFSWTGTQIAEFTNLLGMFPTRNFQRGVLTNWERIEGEEYSKVRLGKTACYACTIHCGSFIRSGPGKFGGVWRTKGPEYETIWAATGNIDYADRDYTMEYDRLCDELGVDSISTGAAIGFAFELYEKGLLTMEDTGGLELTWGNYGAALELIRLIAFRQGIGDLLAEGVKRAAERMGKGAERYAMHVKGLELPAYDPRGAKAHGLNLGTATIGGSHNYGYAPQEVLGMPIPVPMPEGVDRFSTQGKGELAKANQDFTAMMETGFLCSFPALMAPNMAEIQAELLAAATGIEEFADLNYMWKVGERIYNLERMFNVREGITGESDRMPRRFVEEPLPDGASAGQVYEEDELLPQYYQARGWDEKGIPTREKLEELGLGFALG
ncbi:MAG: aldehyde ferredoxin oxidoreductase family protein [Anaerolineae bacterium]